MLSRAYREVTFATRKMVSRIKREMIKEETWNNCERKIFPGGGNTNVNSGKCRLFRILIQRESRTSWRWEGEIKEEKGKELVGWFCPRTRGHTVTFFYLCII